MANVLDDLKPKILAMALRRLRGRLVMPSLVNRDYSPDTSTRGESVNVPIPPQVATREVSPGVTPAAAPDHTANTTPIALDQWHEAPIHFTDKDRVETIDASVEMAVEAAADALAEQVNGSVFARYYELYEFVGTPGTTPFTGASPNTYALASEARKVLNRNKAPLANRRIVLDPDAEEAAINLSEFADASFTSQSGVILEGDLGRKLGADWFMDQQVPTHESTPLTAGDATVDGVHAEGATTISISKATNASPLVQGDIIEIAGDDQTYVVTADVELAVGDTDVTIAPGLKVATEGGEAVTLKGSHVVNLAMHRDAFALAVRAFRDPASDADVMTMVDDVTGLPLRLEVTRQNKQDYWSFDLLWGVKVIRPELGVRIAG